MKLVRFHHPRYNANNVLIDELFNNFFRNDYHEDYLKSCSAKPANNIYETDKDFKIELMLPGFAKEDLELIQKEDLLTVKVEKKEEERNADYKYAHREFGAQNVEKKYRLPKTVDTENISAKFENGILSVTLPKKEEAQEKAPVSIEIS